MKDQPAVNRLLDLLTTVTSWIAVLCVIGIVGFTGVEIICRWVFNFSLRGPEELTAFMLIGVSFMGLAYTFVQGGHISVDTFSKLLPSVWQKRLSIVHGVIGFSFCAALTYYGSKLVVQNIAFNSHSTSAWNVPLVIPSIFIPIGTGTLGLIMVAYTIRLIRSG
jgi:TRAP-type C4-dicarboxylate transport system permease small subunit